MIKKSVETVYREIRETLENGGQVVFSTVAKRWKMTGSKALDRIRLISEGKLQFRTGNHGPAGKWLPAGSGMIHEGTDYFVPMVDITIRPGATRETTLILSK